MSNHDNPSRLFPGVEQVQTCTSVDKGQGPSRVVRVCCVCLSPPSTHTSGPPGEWQGWFDNLFKILTRNVSVLLVFLALSPVDDRDSWVSWWITVGIPNILSVRRSSPVLASERQLEISEEQNFMVFLFSYNLRHLQVAAVWQDQRQCSSTLFHWTWIILICGDAWIIPLNSPYFIVRTTPIKRIRKGKVS